MLLDWASTPASVRCSVAVVCGVVEDRAAARQRRSGTVDRRGRVWHALLDRGGRRDDLAGEPGS